MVISPLWSSFSSIFFIIVGSCLGEEKGRAGHAVSARRRLNGLAHRKRNYYRSVLPGPFYLLPCHQKPYTRWHAWVASSTMGLTQFDHDIYEKTGFMCSHLTRTLYSLSQHAFCPSLCYAMLDCYPRNRLWLGEQNDGSGDRPLSEHMGLNNSTSPRQTCIYANMCSGEGIY